MGTRHRTIRQDEYDMIYRVNLFRSSGSLLCCKCGDYHGIMYDCGWTVTVIPDSKPSDFHSPADEVTK